MERLGIAEAAARLGVSVDTMRRRIRKGEVTAARDNSNRWMIELPADTPPPFMPGQPAHAAVADTAGVADALRAQVADLVARLDRAETREAELHAAAERQGRELTAAQLRATIAESEARAARDAADAKEAGLREALAEARRPAWRRWLGLP